MEEHLPSCSDHRTHFHIIADGLCAYLDDLPPLACAARGLVTDAGWQAHCHSCWPDWSPFLPGHPKRRVRALRAPPSEVEQPLRKIDPATVRPQQRDNLVLLELKRAGAVLWRSASRVLVHQPVYNFHGHDLVEEAEFDMPASIVAAIDTAMIQWWQRSGLTWPPPDYEPTGLGCIRDLTEFDIECWLQVWILGEAVGPLVLRPSMPLFRIAWEVVIPHGEAISTFHYSQDFGEDNDLYGSIDLELSLHRKEYQTRGMDAPIKALASLTGGVCGHESFLMYGFLSKLGNVYV